LLLRHRAYATHPYILSTDDHVMLSFSLTFAAASDCGKWACRYEKIRSVCAVGEWSDLIIKNFACIYAEYVVS